MRVDKGAGFLVRVLTRILDEPVPIMGATLFCILVAGCFEQFSRDVFPIRGSIQIHPGYVKGSLTAIGRTPADFETELANAALSHEVLSNAVRQIDESRFALLDGSDPVKTLQSQLQVRVNSAADQVEIGLNSPFPHQAATMVNALMQSLVSSQKGANGPDKTPVIDPALVTKIDAATADVPALGLPPALVVAISAVVGLFLGLGFTLIKEFFDQRVRSAGQIEGDLDVGALGSFPWLSSQLSTVGRGLASYIDPTSEAAVRTRAIWLKATGEGGRPAGTYLITSPARGDGRSTVALNLATTLAMSGASVVLVDADIESPVGSKLLEEREPSLGLCEALENPSAANKFVRPTHVKNLHLLSCQNPSSTTADKLQSITMEKVLSKLGEKYTHILLDSGPVLGHPVTWKLAGYCQATLLILQSRRTRLADAEKCRKLLHEHGAASIFALVNARHRMERRKYARNPCQSKVPQAATKEYYDDIYNYGWFQQKNAA